LFSKNFWSIERSNSCGRLL